MTSFPFSDEVKIIAELEELHRLYGDNIGDVINGADANITRLWKEYRSQQKQLGQNNV